MANPRSRYREGQKETSLSENSILDNRSLDNGAESIQVLHLSACDRRRSLSAVASSMEHLMVTRSGSFEAGLLSEAGTGLS